MGRYDKIKVYNGSEWVKPSRIRVYINDSWRDFGTDQSANTETLETYYNNAWRRITLNRSEKVITGEQYTQGAFSLLPASAFGYNGYVGAGDFKIKCTVRKTVDDTVTVFRTGTKNDCLFQIDWQADGSFKITNKGPYYTDGSYAGTRTATNTTSKKVLKDTWVTIEVLQPKGSYYLHVTINGEKQTFTNLYYTWERTDATNTIGGANVQFKDTLLVQGNTWSGKLTKKEINMNTASGSTSDYTGITHVNTTTTEVIWI